MKTVTKTKVDDLKTYGLFLIFSHFFLLKLFSFSFGVECSIGFVILINLLILLFYSLFFKLFFTELGLLLFVFLLLIFIATITRRSSICCHIF